MALRHLRPRLDVIVDKETGVLLQLKQYAYTLNRWTSITTVRDLEIGAPSSASDFTVPKPANAVVIDHDYGFRPASPSEAAAMVGYQPLLPGNTLGRALSELAAARKTSFPIPGGPSFDDAVSARYGDGAGAITVASWRGKITDLPGLGGRTIQLKRGPLAADSTNLDRPPFGGAYLTAFHNGLIVRISAPSEQEAITVAESLRVAS